MKYSYDNRPKMQSIIIFVCFNYPILASKKAFCVAKFPLPTYEIAQSEYHEYGSEYLTCLKSSASEADE